MQQKLALALPLCACLYACPASKPREPAKETAADLSAPPPAPAPLPAPHVAVGSTRGLPVELVAALADTPHFSALPQPQPGDWLAEHEEPGQTVTQFLASAPNVPRAPRDTIYLLPIGPPDSFAGAGSPALDVLEAHTRAYFGLEVERLGAVEVGALALDTREHDGHRQLHTGSVLEALSPRLPEDAYCLIGLTMEDLYPGEQWNYVFGYASLHGRVGVYSFARYDPAFFGASRPAAVEQLILRRSLHVMSHEIGHMFGLKHCVHYSCNLNGSNNLDEADRQPLHLCPVCLRKLHALTGLDPVARYEALDAFYRAHELRPEAAWTSTRLDYIARASSR